MADRHLPTSTYRLQLHAGFGFPDAARIVPYLSRLGVSHLYLSPILQAAPGSMHGYDVVDHATVSKDLGGQGALVALAETAHKHGLGIVVDVVPNHMAIPTPEHLNKQLWETLRDGPESPSAHWFDVDWDQCDGRLGLPMLGGSLADVLEAGELTIGELGSQPVLRYAEHVFPLAPGSDTSDLEKLLARQHYLLAGWREKAEVLNYRRFFDVDTLIAVRVELEDVFDATHAVLLDLHRRGVVDGFRIDHPDGLADPQGYLERLRDETDGSWVVVEKILGSDERLPSSWPCAGTTGYDAIRGIQEALVPAVGTALDERWRSTGGEPSLHEVELDAKRLVLTNLFQPEVGRLAKAAVAAAAAIGESLDLSTARTALTELLAHVEVYRAYLRPGLPADPDASLRLAGMVRHAARSRPDLVGPLAVLKQLLVDTLTSNPAGRDLVVRFQQVCGPVMAKGIEDTTFYRWHRLVALNEVGGDPLSLDSPDDESLHAWARHQVDEHPHGMTGLSTHDTKRSEDVRARLLAAAEHLDRWDAAWDAVRRHAVACGVDVPTAYLLMQTLLGAWPLDSERLTSYMRKAVRESKLHTTWDHPDEDYESRVLELTDACLAAPVSGAICEVVAAIAQGTRGTTLGSKLVQLTLPGVPDIYQGTEVVSLALVDPDNRRAVDYAYRAELLEGLDAGSSLGDQDLDAEKLLVTSRVLRLRRDRPELFGAGADYRAVAGTSPHLLGFRRGDRAATLVTRWPGLLAETGWGETTVDLPAGSWTDVLTETRHEIGSAGALCRLVFATLPVALLVRESA